MKGEISIKVQISRDGKECQADLTLVDGKMGMVVNKDESINIDGAIWDETVYPALQVLRMHLEHQAKTRSLKAVQ